MNQPREPLSALPLARETLQFVLVSLIDLLMTLVLIRQPHFHEGNPVARFFLNHWGPKGMVWFKLGMVVLVAVLAQVIARKRPAVARRLLNFATVVVVLVVVYSLWLLLRFGNVL